MSLTTSTPFSFPFPLDPNWGGAGAAKKTAKELPLLFTPITQKDLRLKNRIVVSPMCQYTSEDGFMNDWHLVHLGTFAKGGAGLIIFEATAVAFNGRISPWDSGLWKDEQIAPLEKIVTFIHAHKTAAALQIAHAGRKASTKPLFLPNARHAISPAESGYAAVGPSSEPWNEYYQVPKELTVAEIKEVVQQFADTAARALKAGFDLIEIHGAHGYLINSFLSPLSNHRTDEYGGDFENRSRFLTEVVRAVQKVWPSSKPLWVRLSCSEWVDGGWNIEDTVKLAHKLKELGVDVIDCSSGGNSSLQKLSEGPLWQTPFAERIKKSVGIATATVGVITKPTEAEDILKNNRADFVVMAREFLREPFWPLKAAFEFGVEVDVVPEYARAQSHFGKL